MGNMRLWVNVVDFPFRESCIQVCDVADDFCFVWISFCFDSGVGDVDIHFKRWLCRTLVEKALPVVR